MGGYSVDIDNVIKALTEGLAPLAAPDSISGSEWVNRNFYLSAESSYGEGRFECYPYQRGMADIMCSDSVPVVAIQKSARVGYTKLLVATSLYYTHTRRRNQVIYQPTDSDAEDFVKDELDTALRDVECMHSVFPAMMARHKNNTLQQKTFLSSVTKIRGGTAAKNYRRITADVVIIDEYAAFPADVEGEGHPGILAKKRLEGATFPKFIVGSTPGLTGACLISAATAAAAITLNYYVPCPHCGDMHRLEWGGPECGYGIKWHSADPSTATYLCPHCHAHYTQDQYLGVWEQGIWMSPSGVRMLPGCKFVDATGQPLPAPESVALKIWAAYSKQVAWSSIVQEFLAACREKKRGDSGPLKTWTNTTLGESYGEAEEKTDADQLRARAESYPAGVIPLGGLVVVSAVDVQGDRFELADWAYGAGEEAWYIDHRKIYANPAARESWAELDAVLAEPIRHASGQLLKREAVAIDTGGHYTQESYEYCRPRRAGEEPHKYRGKLFAIKGETHNKSGPIRGRVTKADIRKDGKINKHGIKLHFVGTDTAKDQLFSRLALPNPGPGFIHLSRHLPPEVFDQLTAERRIMQRDKWGRENHYWYNPPGTRNEAWDCAVYALFLIHALKLTSWTDRQWQALADIVQPPVADLFAQPPAQSPAPLDAPPKPKPEARPTAPTVPRDKTPRRVIETGGEIGNSSWL